MAWVNHSTLRSQLPARLATEDIQEWEQYHIPAHEIEFIGILSNTGASGQVWRARYKNREVAVKCISLSATEGPALEALKRETVVLLHIAKDCRHACKFFGVTVKDNAFCIVMKLYPSNLSKEILQSAGGKLSVKRSLQHGIVIAKAVAELHMLGVIICDLKPDNILLDDLGDPVLTDFGLSRIVNSTQRGFVPSSMQGTPNYMSPEQFDPNAVSCGTGSAVVTEKADVWAFACTMIHMLTGVAPWNNDNIYQICCKVIISKHSPAVPHHIPADLSKLLSHCLQLTPSLRPSAKELLQSLTDCMDALVVANSISHMSYANERGFSQQQQQQQQLVEGGSVMPSTPSPMPHPHVIPLDEPVASNDDPTFSPLQFYRLPNAAPPPMPLAHPTPGQPSVFGPQHRHPVAPHHTSQPIRSLSPPPEAHASRLGWPQSAAHRDEISFNAPHNTGHTGRYAAARVHDTDTTLPRRWPPLHAVKAMHSSRQAAEWSADAAAALSCDGGRPCRLDHHYPMKRERVEHLEHPHLHALDTEPMQDQSSSFAQHAQAGTSKDSALMHAPWLSYTTHGTGSQPLEYWETSQTQPQVPNSEPMDMLCSPRPRPAAFSNTHQPRLQPALSQQQTGQSAANAGMLPGRHVLNVSLARSHTAPALPGSANGLSNLVISHDGSLCSSHTAYRDANIVSMPDSMILCTAADAAASMNPTPPSCFTDEHDSRPLRAPSWSTRPQPDRQHPRPRQEQPTPSHRIPSNHLFGTSWAPTRRTSNASSLNPHSNAADMLHHAGLADQSPAPMCRPVSSAAMMLPDPRAPAYPAENYQSQSAEHNISFQSAFQHRASGGNSVMLQLGSNNTAAAAAETGQQQSYSWECPMDSNARHAASGSLEAVAQPQPASNVQMNDGEEWQIVPAARISSSSPMAHRMVEASQAFINTSGTPVLWTPEPEAPSPWVRRVLLPATLKENVPPEAGHTSWNSSLDMPAAAPRNLSHLNDNSHTACDCEQAALGPLGPLPAEQGAVAGGLTHPSYVHHNRSHSKSDSEYIHEPWPISAAGEHVDGYGLLQRQVLSYVWQLTNGHTTVISQMLTALAALAQQDDNHAVLLQCSVPSAVLTTLHAHVNNAGVVRQALEVLHQLSLNGVSPMRIVPSMVDLLQYQDESVMHKALCILRNLCCEENNKTLAPDAGALEPLIRLLSHPEPAIILEAAGTLKTLATTDSNKRLICLAGAARPLLSLLQHDFIPVVEQAVWTVINLSALPANRSELLALDGHKLIHQIMQQNPQHSELCTAAAAALRCLGYSAAESSYS